MSAYYNEIDPYAAQWLRNLIDKGLIAPGVVDERNIEDVKPDELMGYTQCHFFAGIGVWSLALRRSGWLDNRPIWTGSCPCQPFSSAGSQSGFEDARHLWPSLAWLIKQCDPSVVVGEQVASKSVEPWIDLVQTDLEALDYAFGCVPFPSAGVGAPNIRDRAYWVGHASGQGLEERFGIYPGGLADTKLQQRPSCQTCDYEASGRNEESAAASGFCSDSRPGPANGFWSAADWLGCRDGKWRPVEPGTFPLADGITSRVGRLRAYGNAINAEAARIFIQSVMELLNSSAGREFAA